MKLLFVSNMYPTPWDTTRGIFNRGLVEALRRAGHDVRCVVPVSWVNRLRWAMRGVRRSAGEAQTQYPVWFYPPKLSRTHFDTFMWYSVHGALRRSTRNWTPDAVIGYWLHPDAAVAARFAREIGALAVAISGGSDMLIITRESARRSVVARVLQEVDAVFTDGRHLREAAIALGTDPARVHSFYRGVDPLLFRPGDRAEARRRLGIPEDRRVLLAVGNLVPVKGFDVLLKALQRITSTAPWQLIIAGDGPLRRSLEEQVVDLGLADQVRFAGRVPHDELPQWFHAADHFVLASRSEGVPNVLLEAMACGVPFTATSVGGVPEIAPDPSWLVAPERPDSLAEALEAAYQGPRAVPPAATFDWNATTALIAGEVKRLIEART